MITVSEAKSIIQESVHALPPAHRSIGAAAGLMLAEDVYAQTDIPAFEQSSMDGYAIRFEDKAFALHIRGEMPAGAESEIVFEKGEAVRIFTGAPLPAGADTIVMQENVLVKDGMIHIQDETLAKGQHVRNKGAETKVGSLAMRKDTHLSPAAIGFLAGLGIHEVLVYPLPSVCLLVTGKELQTPGKPLNRGQVYESSSYSLTAALRQSGVYDIRVIQVDDDLALLKNELATALEVSDLILITGGVSVGDYDFVVQAAGLCGVEQLFHKVKQKPGKPLYFGMKDNKPVFGLPGNPSSVLTCFYNYVASALALLSRRPTGIRVTEAVLDHSYSKPVGLTHFLKGFYRAGSVSILGAQESYRMSSFAEANCLICLEELRGDFMAGEKVAVILI
jgi:molybdopterin molybdotransferase